MSLSSFIGNTVSKVSNSVKNILSDVKSKLSNIVGNAAANFTSLWDGGFAGISREGIEQLRSALNSYVDNIEDHIQQFNTVTAAEGAISGDVREAVSDYSESVKALLSAYVSTMRVNISDLDTAFEAYIRQTDELAGSITTDADALREAAKKIDLDTANGVALSMPSFEGSLASKYVPGSNPIDKIMTGTENAFDTFLDGATSVVQWVADLPAKVTSTAAVLTNAVVFGVAEVGEDIFDGIVMAGGYLTAGGAWVVDQFTGGNSAKNILDNVTDFVGTDAVGEAKSWFYEDSSIGQFINDKSFAKYDGKLASGVEKVAEIGTKAVIATVVTGATGGAGALAVGGIYGLGNSTENYAQTVNRAAGEEYNYGKMAWKNAVGIGAGSTEFFSLGGAGNALVTATKKAIPDATFGQGVKFIGHRSMELAKQGGTQFVKNFSWKGFKDGLGVSLKAGGKALAHPENVINNAMPIVDNIVEASFGNASPADALATAVTEADAIILNDVIVSNENLGHLIINSLDDLDDAIFGAMLP